MNRVLVALSGGVDSSLAAALVLERGCRIETCILLMQGVSDRARASARSIARHLGVDHHEFDVTREFDDCVVSYFINEYKCGRTPNPCVICNEQIKLNVLLEKAEELSCESIATGHYARIAGANNRCILKRGADKNEQSYFLYRVKQRHLERLSLPLGDMARPEVETCAQSRHLPGARQKKSQDICFIPDNNYLAFLSRYVPFKPGPIKDTSGKILGEHKGIWGFTIGQRRGLGISAAYPLYVIGIEAESNTVIVGPKKDAYASVAIVTDVNFIPFDTLAKKVNVKAKPRYLAELSPATIEPVFSNEVKVTFAEPQWALTPGQSVVFYDDDILLGGGIIK
jgi:tRNA-specific 2-thiouridylase